jgi:hypothetical protein
VRVRISAAAADEPAESWPQFDAMPVLPGMEEPRREWQAYFAGKGVASAMDPLSRTLRREGESR